jgi:hypothetical protein
MKRELVPGNSSGFPDVQSKAVIGFKASARHAPAVIFASPFHLAPRRAQFAAVTIDMHGK